jgi:hypothetical protein
MKNFQKEYNGKVLVLRDIYMMPSVEINAKTCKLRCFTDQNEIDCFEEKRKQESENGESESQSSAVRGKWYTHGNFRFAKLGAERIVIATTSDHHIAKNQAIASCHLTKVAHCKNGSFFKRKSSGTLFVANGVDAAFTIGS